MLGDEEHSSDAGAARDVTATRVTSRAALSRRQADSTHSPLCVSAVYVTRNKQVRGGSTCAGESCTAQCEAGGSSESVLPVSSCFCCLRVNVSPQH